MSTKSLPSAPSPCIQTMLAAGAVAVSISMVSSRSATFSLSRTAGSRQRHGGARRLGEVEGLERRGGAPVASGQGLELEAPLDQLQHRGVVVLAMADDIGASRRATRSAPARACRARSGRPRAGARDRTSRPLVVGDHDDRARPVTARHHLLHHLADPPIARAHRRRHRVGVVASSAASRRPPRAGRRRGAPARTRTRRGCGSGPRASP